MSTIKKSLEKLFLKYRVVFWYDAKKELTEEYQALAMADVVKIEVQGNEFEIKHIVNKQKPTTKFLLYLPYTKPENEENWLLDMELTYHIFRTDQEAMFLQEMGLGYHLKDLVATHIEFFRAKDRRVKLKELLGKDDLQDDIRAKMLAIVFQTDYVNLNTYIHAHSADFINGNQKFDNTLERYNLTTYYWGKIKHHFNYKSNTPSIYDFLLEVFNANFVLGKKSDLSKDAKLLLSLWKDTIQYRESFGLVATKIAKDTTLENRLQNTSIATIVNDDLYQLVDQKIIYELVDLLINETISFENVTKTVKARENKYWFKKSEHLYKSILQASELILLVKKHANKKYYYLEEGVTHYAKELFEIDQCYRKFIWHYRQSNQNSILANLVKKIEKIYVNDWLYTYNNNWQNTIDNLQEWQTNTKTSQQQFFKQHVAPFINKKQRLFVIISDALRYECGAELSKMLQSENRYEANIEYMVSSLPSYTQLGMASMLPHNTLSFHKNTDTINVDAIASTGIQGRTKILETNSGVRATAIKAADFMNFKANTDGREFVKQYDLIYIYHNRIDKTGDDTTSEEKVFEAVADELIYLKEIIKKIANMNGNNMMITSDHGFIYQHSILDESDFVKSNHKGTIWKENRRFVIGKDLKNDKATKLFRATDLNIQSDADVLIPKSINRLRIKGSGSRFVHGGATLQEIVIPLIKVNKKRKNTTSQVAIDIIKTTDRINTNILAVSFLQKDLVTDTILPRTIRAAIYAEDGERLSDTFNYTFDIAQGSERQREVKHIFQLMAKASGKYKNQRVALLIEEPVTKTNKWKEYSKHHYTLNISFTNDFDEF